MAVEFITITMDEYNELVERSDFLACLEACGVENWSGYDDSVDMFEVDELEVVDVSKTTSFFLTSEGDVTVDELYEDEDDEDDWY